MTDLMITKLADNAYTWPCNECHAEHTLGDDSYRGLWLSNYSPDNPGLNVQLHAGPDPLITVDVPADFCSPITTKFTLGEAAEMAAILLELVAQATRAAA